MPSSNPQTSPLEAFGNGLELLTVAFIPAGGVSPTTVFGPFSPTVARTLAGDYTITLNGFVPKAWLGAFVNIDVAGVPTYRAEIGGPVVSQATKTTTLRLITRLASNGAQADVPANAANLVRICALFKTFPGKDSTGL